MHLHQRRRHSDVCKDTLLRTRRRGVQRADRLSDGPRQSLRRTWSGGAHACERCPAALPELGAVLDPDKNDATIGHLPDWMTWPYAIGAESATVTINVAANSAASSSVLPMLASHEVAAPSAIFVSAETVAQRALDGLWPDITESDDLVFLKADVQGYERQVLDGVAGHLNQLVGLQLELSLVPLYEGSWLYDEALDWARQQGFTLMRLIPGFTHERSGQMLQADGVFFR